MRIGFIGLGNMGGPMALNMIKAGHALTVYDLRRAAADPHLAAGARWADSPAAVAAECEVVVTSLPGPKEIEEVALGEGGIIGRIARGAIYADLSTNSPAVIRRLHAAFKEKGIEVLDTPVSGGVPGARNATLAVRSAEAVRLSRRSSRRWTLSATRFPTSARAGRVRSPSWFTT